MTQTKMAPMFRPPELIHMPAEWPVTWQWWFRGDYIAGFKTEEAARLYGEMKGWK